MQEEQQDDGTQAVQAHDEGTQVVQAHDEGTQAASPDSGWDEQTAGTQYQPGMTIAQHDVRFSLPWAPLCTAMLLVGAPRCLLALAGMNARAVIEGSAPWRKHLASVCCQQKQVIVCRPPEALLARATMCECVCHRGCRPSSHLRRSRLLRCKIASGASSATRRQAGLAPAHCLASRTLQSA